MTTHYRTLRCPPASSYETLHAAYLELAEFMHHNGNFDPEFAEVTVAWATLKGVESRRLYDTKLRLERVLNCPACGGNGLVVKSKSFTQRTELKCEACGGTGEKQ